MVRLKKKSGAGNTGTSIALIGNISFLLENDTQATNTPAQPTTSAAWS